MISKKRLSRRTIDALKPGAKERTVWDSEVRGLGVRILPSGLRSFIIYYREQGALKRKTIGRHPDITIERAREVARGVWSALAGGDTPSITNPDRTLRELWEQFDRDYLAHHTKPETQRAYKIAYRNHIAPVFADHTIEQITRDRLVRWHTNMNHVPITANRALMLMVALFNKAKLWGWTRDNPAEGIKRYKEARRERYLAPDELKRLGEALAMYDALGGSKRHVARLVRLLLLTGARLKEIMHARLEWIDDERGVLRLPDSKTGAKEIVLSDAALAIIDEVKCDPEHRSAYLIPGNAAARRRGGDQNEDIPMGTPQKAWAQLLKHAKIEDLRLHDLRHTFATVALDRTKNLALVGGLLGHSHSATTARYAHLMDDPKRKAAQDTGKAIASMIGR
ncbi:MAG: tyrosine-type recombinase/integrase [Pseudomonadota bacterium]